MSRRGLGWLALLGLFALHQDLLMTWLVRERTRDEGPE